MRNVFAGVDLRYRWFPSKRLGLVITPHLGAIVPIYKSSAPTVGDQTYDLLPVIPLPQLLIGYEIDVLKYRIPRARRVGRPTTFRSRDSHTRARYRGPVRA